MRTIVLWDIDQTLLYTGGAGMKGMRRAFHDLYGVDDSFGRVEFSGRTDWAIFSDEARIQGFTPDRVRRELPRFIDAYIPHLETAMREAAGGTLKPGVIGVLAELQEREDVLQGLGTGNFRRACESKLRHFGIDAYFPGFVGGFGEDSEDRHEVIAAGIERLRNGGHASRIVIIGDTPNDVSAAKANGAFALAVATGATASQICSPPAPMPRSPISPMSIAPLTSSVAPERTQNVPAQLQFRPVVELHGASRREPALLVQAAGNP